MKLLDARSILGLPLTAGPDEIEEHWAKHGEVHGFPLRLDEKQLLAIQEEGTLIQVVEVRDEEDRLWRHHILHPDLPTDLRTMKRQVLAYVNEGRWVADCPECASGIALPRDMKRAACLGCGRLWPIKWPGPKTLAKVEDELDGLPSFEQQWHPDPPAAEPKKLYSDGWAVPAEPDAEPAPEVEEAA